ncbi:hypothetical protein Cgig2_015808 [Carnegiea gigantea]|uniref:Uncharacterized protein n=1 Tax=Carnegiea gigantea TaxID=171969 RepID=A0A9Q1KIG4_9CARY|nr:hypothetical protein Cgig2_015808 [Carnegiea gigantea]
MIAQICDELLSLDNSTSNLLSFERVRMCILTDSMPSIVEEIIIEEGQGSHIVSILEDGCLGTPLIYSTKVNAMKGKVVFRDKFGNHGDSVVQGIDNQRQTQFSSSEHVVSQQPEMEISGENTNGRVWTASCNFLETREDALAINATSSPAPNHKSKEPAIPETPILPDLLLAIGPNIVPYLNSLAPVTSKEPSLGLGHSSFKEHSKKKKGKKRLKQGKNIRRGSLARKRKIDFSKAIREYQLSKTPNKFSQKDIEMAKEVDLAVEVEQPSIKPEELESEKPTSNSISAEELIEFSKKLGVAFIGNGVVVKKKLSEMLKSRD